MTVGTIFFFSHSEKFAQHWCALLSNTSSVFAACHSVVDPAVYIKVRHWSKSGAYSCPEVDPAAKEVWSSGVK